MKNRFGFLSFILVLQKNVYGSEEKNNRCGYNPILGKWG